MVTSKVDVNTRRAAAVVLIAIALVATGLDTAPRAQQPANRTLIDVQKMGPQVGQPIPDFSLEDQSGKTWTRQSIMGPKGAMIVFFRSADW